MSTNKIYTKAKHDMYTKNAQIIKFFRRNPCVAARDLLGINLTDAQKWILQETWNSQVAVWACCRNFGKSFLIAIVTLLTAILYPDQNIYIISSVGSQAKETFIKLEEIVNNSGATAASILSLKDIASKEILKSQNNSTGFKHDPLSYSCEFFNGSKIFTLNSEPDNNRGKRASLVIYDECAFCQDKLIYATEPFVSQDSDFKSSINSDASVSLLPLSKPNKIIYASSQDDTDTVFYQRYKEAAKKMVAGNRDYFCCDMPCDSAITVYMDGKKYASLLKQSTVDAALAADKDKALREYYNKPTADNIDGQIVPRSAIRKLEKDILPYCEHRPDDKIVLAFDPARSKDNSILSGMNIYYDEETGYNGDIIQCQNFIDTTSKSKYKLDSKRQLQKIREIIEKYTGEDMLYKNLDQLLIDSGSGGGGVSAYSDNLLDDWVDSKGNKRYGLIDKSSELYSDYTKIYPNAVDKIKLVSPNKYRTQMIQEMLELVELGVIHFPHEYTHPEIKISEINSNGDEEIISYSLTTDEIINLQQIDLMKAEIASIHKTENQEKTSVTYSLAKEKANKMHDDRFYTFILLAHRLYEIRRSDKKKRDKKGGTKKLSDISMRRPSICK